MVFAQLPAPAGRLVRQQVAFVRPPVPKGSFGIAPKPLGRGPIAFHFWHDLVLAMFACNRHYNLETSK